MKKRLTVNGNSLALIIDKPTRRLLNIGPYSILDVSIVGHRLVIEPTGERLDRSEVEGAAPSRLDKHEETRHNDESLAVERSNMSKRALDLDARDIFAELERHGLNRQWLSALSHEIPRLGLGHSWISFRNPATNATPEQLATLRRFRICRDRLRADATWEEAIKAALAAYPKEEGTRPAAGADGAIASVPTARPS
jgi:hypothetical protein